MVSRLMGSPSSPVMRIWRLRALYRKQYLTPTIILSTLLRLHEIAAPEANQRGDGSMLTKDL